MSETAANQNGEQRGTRQRKRRRWLWIYLVLLGASHLVQPLLPEEWFRLEAPPAQHVEVTAATSSGETQTVRMGYIEWAAEGPDARPDRPVVLLIHGSPGQAPDFAGMGPLIAAAGYRTIAVDMPGFNESSAMVSDYSILADAHATLAMLDALKIGRVHLVGWSNGGGVALHMADTAPERVASMTLLAAIGAQENEGSGDYCFEHFKYALAYAGLVVLPEFVPHFGVLGPRQLRHAFARNFWDSDQRPLRAIMERTRVPTLVLHGRHDVLIPARAAEEHHRLITTSRLVMLPTNHFLPFTHAGETASYLVPFFARHDAAGVPALTDTLDLAPERQPSGVRGLARIAGDAMREAPWWAHSTVIGLVVLLLPTIGVLGAAMVVAHGDVDLAVALVGVLAGLLGQTLLMLATGRTLRERVYRVPWIGGRLGSVSIPDWSERLRRDPFTHGWRGGLMPVLRTPNLMGAALSSHSWGSMTLFLGGRAAGVIVWSLLSMIPALVCVALIVNPLDRALGIAGGLLGLVVTGVVITGVPMMASKRGRQMMAARIARTLRYEYWPAFVFYLPLVPYIARLALKHRGLTVFTCCNPGIENGGGFIGESKAAIQAALAHSGLSLAAARIPGEGTAEERAALVLKAMREDAAIGAFPVILKPDAGQRGFGVKLAHTEEEVVAYFRGMASPAMVQRYHAGPHECGVLWARRAGESTGFIYSIARKDFPFVTGDGESTLEDLIYAHRRFRRQAHIFLKRFADRASWTPALGERVRMAESGNHCQGTLFRDGADLITPELTLAIDRLATSFGGNGEGLLDFGRFDVRYESEEALCEGRGLGIVELNGTTGESTNLYDPDKSLLWAYRVLFGQWRLLYELGAQRRDAGARPLSVRELVSMARAHYRARSGSELAD